MTIEDLRQKVYRDLDSRGLKNPSIRKGALNNVLEFIKTTEIFFNDKELNLPSDKDSLKLTYQKYKGKVLNSAESSVINTMYEHYKGKHQSSSAISSNKEKEIKPKSNSLELSGKNNETATESIEENLLKGVFLGVSELNNGKRVPTIPGLYCIKLKDGAKFPKDYGKIREDGIIYIGKASQSLKARLWEEELNHQRPATFFRSIGAMLGFLPPKGSLIGKKNTRNYNYKFSIEDTEKIKTWMKESLLVKFISLPQARLEAVETALIEKLTPLVNIKHNPCASEELIKARKKCVDWAKTKH